MRLKQLRVCFISVWFVIAFFVSIETALSQSEAVNTQYYLNPISINPGFTGFRNAFALDLSVRKEWIGFKDAPSSGYFSLHSPLSNSKISLGACIKQSQTGSLVYTHLSFDYSYLLRLGDRMFLSLGLDAGLINQRLALSDLVVVDEGDPNFSTTKFSRLIPFVGVGAVLLTPTFYFGISSPTIPLGYLDLEEVPLFQVNYLGNYYATGGVSLPAFHKVVVKYSVIGRFADKNNLLIDNTLRFNYNGFVGIGASYRTNSTAAALAIFQVSKGLGIIYSYDFPLSQSSAFRKDAHEITISYDLSQHTRKNKYRAFKRKKVVEEEMMRSIRYF